MAHDVARTGPQPVSGPPVQDVALPVPRAPLESPAREAVPPAPRAGTREVSRVAHRPARVPRAGWVLTAVAAVGAAWVVGWVAGVTWAWREMTPRFMHRTHRRRAAAVPGV